MREKKLLIFIFANILIFSSSNQELKNTFKLITTLLNKTDDEQTEEYITRFEKNLLHESIDEIHAIPVCHYSEKDLLPLPKNCKPAEWTKLNKNEGQKNSFVQRFKLLTNLYNEKNNDRIAEYITCLENNLNHESINKIHILYDTSNDDNENKLLAYLKKKNVIISYLKKRQTYQDCFDFANKCYPNSKIILCNADIYFNNTLKLLDSYDLTNKFLALTRWDETNDGKLLPLIRPDGSEISNSQDETPLRKFENSKIEIGIMGCDRHIAYQAMASGLEVLNPCFSIQCCHLHLSNIRNYDNNLILSTNKDSINTPFCKLE